MRVSGIACTYALTFTLVIVYEGTRVSRSGPHHDSLTHLPVALTSLTATHLRTTLLIKISTHSVTAYEYESHNPTGSDSDSLARASVRAQSSEAKHADQCVRHLHVVAAARPAQGPGKYSRARHISHCGDATV